MPAKLFFSGSKIREYMPRKAKRTHAGIGNTNRTNVWRGFRRPMKVIKAAIELSEPILG